MNTGLSDRIRSFTRRRYVEPELQAGRTRFAVKVKDVEKDLKIEGFPSQHANQICVALTGPKFLGENNLEIERVDGPPSKRSPTVVVHYRVADSTQVPAPLETDLPREDPSARATRLTEKLRGILKDEIAGMGGAEAFIRWVRSEDDEAA